MFFSSLSAKPVVCAWPEAMQTCLDWLKDHDPAAMEPGIYPIQGEDIYADVQVNQTVRPEEKRGESHYRYVDIQYLVSGEEIQGYALLREGSDPEKEEHPEKDIMFYREVPEQQFVRLLPGDFTVYFPNDIHNANLTFGESKPLRKVVFKIRAELMR